MEAEDVHKKRKRDEDEPAGESDSSDDEVEKEKEDARVQLHSRPHLLIDVDNPVITLSALEENLFNLLLSVISHFHLGTTLRAAGGWVRDKLRGAENDDIDIALDNCMGSHFAEKVNEYLSLNKMETHSIGVIKSRPEQSKHLETATMKILDVWVDFVNLRTESYAEDNRIPTSMSLGTPKQDAFRRDLTINSLFYNINEKKIEDWTARGVQDLRDGIIRTPLEPITTFMDDPLRVLRAIRFASRLSYALDEELCLAARTPMVIEALEMKIARERIGAELDGMLHGPHPDLALHYILDLDLFSSVFRLPSAREGRLEEDHKQRAVSSLTKMKRFLASYSPGLDKEMKRRLLLAALFKVYRGLTYKNSKKRVLPVVDFIIREELKLRGKDAEDICLILHHCDSFSELVKASKQGKLERKTAGLVIRETKALWVDTLYVTLLDDIPDFLEPVSHKTAHMKLDPTEPVLETVDNFSKQIEDMGLEKVWEMRPLYDGKELVQELNLPLGPKVGKMLQKEVEWQLENPNGTREACLSYLKSALD